jgi:thiol-disulfide isomerase/thioredoxin
MDRGKRRRLMIVMLIAIIVIAASDAALLLHAAFTPTPAYTSYTFETGVNHPQQIKDLMKNGTVVLYLTENGCPPCYTMIPKVADLQSQYKGAGVTFLHFNYDDNSTSQSILSNYVKQLQIDYLPAILVIRGDGATALFKPAINDGVHEIDLNNVKSAIDEAQRWESPTPASN